MHHPGEDACPRCAAVPCAVGTIFVWQLEVLQLAYIFSFWKFLISIWFLNLIIYFLPLNSDPRVRWLYVLQVFLIGSFSFSTSSTENIIFQLCWILYCVLWSNLLLYPKPRCLFLDHVPHYAQTVELYGCVYTMWHKLTITLTGMHFLVSSFFQRISLTFPQVTYALKRS